MLTFEEFVAKCRLILNERPTPGTVSALGYICLPGHSYLDKHVRIVQGEHKGRKLFEVTVRYIDDAGNYTNNPAIQIDGDEIIRRHGDWTRAAEHVEKRAYEIEHDVCPICFGEDGNHLIGCPICFGEDGNHLIGCP